MAKVRMADIAERVGVSTVTVHNALSGQKGVSDEVREKILEVAQEMGYVQNTAAAKREKSRELFHIGVLISEKYLADYTTFYWKMYQEVAILATEKRCMVAVEVLKHEEEDNPVLPKIVEEATVDGLIVIGELKRDYIAFLKQNMKKLEMPLIFLDFYDKDLAKDAVITDNFHGMYFLTEYLFDHGFTKLAYVGNIYVTSSIMDRYCGFHKSMLEHHEVLPEKWLIPDRDMEGAIEFDLPDELPEAFVCNCDLTAGLLIMKLEEKGYRVPEDISVVGFDNYLYPGFPDKKITSYEVNMRAMAKVALDKMLKQLKNSQSGRGLAIVAGRVVEKESVKLNK